MRYLTAERSETGTSRDEVIDGLRGLAIILVVVSHLWIVAPTRGEIGQRLGLLTSSGNYAVTIFLVVAGYLATNGLLRDRTLASTRALGGVFLRRWIRLSSHVYAMVAVLLVVEAIDPGVRQFQGADTTRSVLHVVTYTWTGFLRHDLYRSRPDLGHLWYVCTDLWGVGVVVLLVILFGRRRRSLFQVLVGCLVLVWLYRSFIVRTEGSATALLMWQTRVDGVLWGALAAVAVSGLRSRSRPKCATPLVGVLLGCLVPLAVLVNSANSYLGVFGELLAAVVGLILVGVGLGAVPRMARVALGWHPLRFLGRTSLVLYVWHYPVLWYVWRRLDGQAWPTKLALAVLLTLAAAVPAQLLIEAPVQRWLRRQGAAGSWPHAPG